MNYKLLIQYDGTDFHGWQVQENATPTIQGELERVIGMLEDSKVSVAGSGRTDAGVHAEGQVASVFVKRDFTPQKLQSAINGNLWRDIRILKAEKAPDEFHARFSAKRKTYIYRVVNAPVMSPFWRRFAHHEHRPLDLERMTLASRHLLGEHDWTAFASAQSDGDSRIRTVTDFTINSRWEPRASRTSSSSRSRRTDFFGTWSARSSERCSRSDEAKKILIQFRRPSSAAIEVSQARPPRRMG